MTTTIDTIRTGGNGATAQFLAARELETQGAFALPYLTPGRDVLDVGCGPGTITLGLADAVFPGKATGLDTDTELIGRAQRLAEGLELVNAAFRVGSAYDLPFAAASFDVVFSHAVMEHLATPAKAIAEFTRVLRPGGIVALRSPDWDLFALTPSNDIVQAALDAYRDLQHRSGGDTRAGSKIEGMLADAGFRILDAGTRYEVYPDTRQLAEYLALQLERDEQRRHATALRTWARQLRASLVGAWTHAIARKP